MCLSGSGNSTHCVEGLVYLPHRTTEHRLAKGIYSYFSPLYMFRKTVHVYWWAVSPSTTLYTCIAEGLNPITVTHYYVLWS